MLYTITGKVYGMIKMKVVVTFIEATFGVVQCNFRKGRGWMYGKRLWVLRTVLEKWLKEAKCLFILFKERRTMWKVLFCMVCEDNVIVRRQCTLVESMGEWELNK